MKLILSDRPLDLSIHSDDIVFVDLSACTIANCIGCFGCWTKTPGKCVIRDDATTIYPLIAKSDEVIYISRVKYGGYDTTMKTMLERAIPVQQAFIRIHNGETHHVQRAVVPKKSHHHRLRRQRLRRTGALRTTRCPKCPQHEF